MTLTAHYWIRGPGKGHCIRAEALRDALADLGVFGTVLAFENTEALAETYKHDRPALVTIDFNHLVELDDRMLVSIRCLGARVAVFDRITKHCDVIIHANAVGKDIPFGVKGLTGPRYLVLRQGLSRRRREFKGVKKIALAFGADQSGMAQKVIGALSEMGSFTFLGSSIEEMGKADMAIVSFGQTFFEAMAMGVPSLVFSVSAAHTDAAKRFVGLHMADLPIVVGDVTERNWERRLVAYTRAMVNDANSRETVSMVSRVVDGKGAPRVARILAEGLRECS